MLIMSKHYPVEQRERAVKMVLDHLDEYRSVYAACQTIGPKVGVGAESLRRWVLQAQIDAAQRPGATTAEQQRICRSSRRISCRVPTASARSAGRMTRWPSALPRDAAQML
jgi:transposase-like protein